VVTQEPGERVSSANFLLSIAIKGMDFLGAAIKGMEDEDNANEGKKGVEMESEEMGGSTSLLVSFVCQKPYEEPDEP